MNTRLISFILFAMIIFASCESSKVKKEAENKSIVFFKYLKEENHQQLLSIYEGFGKFETFYKSDSIKVNSSTYKKGIVTVSVHNKFTNPFGKVFEKDILLYFKKDNDGNLTLYDSQGMTDFADVNEYVFGVKTGCVNPKVDTTDQDILKAIAKAKSLMMEKALDIYKDLKKNVTVVNWNWETGWSGSASGQGIVRNNSTFTIPEIKYKITYKDYEGNEITTDEGYVDYNTMAPGQSKSFTFYTSYVANASRASIELVFDEEKIFKFLSETDWTGNECTESFSGNNNNPSL